MTRPVLIRYDTIRDRCKSGCRCDPCRAAAAQRQRDYRLRKARTGTCARCGAPFRWGRGQRYCTAECRDVDYGERMKDRRCAAPGCESVADLGRRYCARDARRLWKTGTLEDPRNVRSMKTQREALERLRTPEALLDGECWEWPAGRQAKGYGLVAPSLTVVASQLAHRNAYAIAYDGELPDDLYVCHRCDNPSCYRPSHLFIGTHADNMQDMAAKGRGVTFAGTSSGRAVFDVNDVLGIVAMRMEGHTYKAIAARWGVHPSTVSRLLNRRTGYLAEVDEALA